MPDKSNQGKTVSADKGPADGFPVCESFYQSCQILQNTHTQKAVLTNIFCSFKISKNAATSKYSVLNVALTFSSFVR